MSGSMPSTRAISRMRRPRVSCCTCRVSLARSTSRWIAWPRSDLRSDLQLVPRHAAIGFEIALARRVHHARRQRRSGGVAVPAAGAALRVEIIAQRLLVEARLRLAGLVGIDRPEARGIRRHHFVDQDDAAVPVAAELEFG